MKIDRKIAHTEAELIAIFKEENINESFYPRFLKRYTFHFNELYEDMKDYEDDDFDGEDSIQASALYVLNLYKKPFLKMIENGHSEEWAHLVAKHYEDDERRIYDAFEELKKTQPELAQQELVLHCNNLSKDKDFRRHYLFLFGLGEGLNDPFEKAANYAEIYKEQIEKGKSKIYAHEFADSADSGDNEIFREEYAYAYDKAISEGKSEDYSREFAENYGSELVDIKGRYGRSEDEEAIEFAIEKVNAHMKAWEYVSEHKLKNAKRFYELYEHRHLNTYFADEGFSEGTLEEVDKDILEKVLLQYNKV